MEFKSDIRKLVEEHPKSYVRMLKCRKDLYDYVLTSTQFLSDVQLSTRLFYIFNDIDQKLRCCECGSELNREFVALSKYEPNRLCCAKCSTKVARRNILDDISNDHTIFNENDAKQIEVEIKTGLESNQSTFRKKCWSSNKSYILKYLNFKFPNLRDDFDWDTKFYWFYHDIKEFPTCEICGKELKQNVFSFSQGYPSVCEDCKILKMRKTNLERYGIENAGNSKDAREKSKLTKLNRYGDENFTNREKYKITCQRLFGGNAPACSIEVREKMKHTNLQRYGVENVFCSNSPVKIKMLQEFKKKHGVDNIMSLESTKRKIGVSERTQFYTSLDNELVEPLFSLEEYCSLDFKERHMNEFKWRCKKCGCEFNSKIIYDGGVEVDGILTHAYCQACHPNLEHVQSRQQMELFEFIKSMFNGTIIQNDRQMISPMELDIYVPERRIAFEYDGLYWHEELQGKDRKYHLNKTNECEKRGIHLIHIFENEWRDKQDIVKYRIRNLFGVYDRTIYARNCHVEQVDSKTSIEFQNANHIQGFVKSSVNIGLYCDNELVSLMTFSKPRFNKSIEWELVRFCSKLGFHVIGAAGKLLKYFERNYNPSSIISYADRRWSIGNLYTRLGFSLDRISPPNYWYFKRGILESRIKYQKHKLNGSLESFDKTKSEVDNMRENGFDRIFDCGNLVFVKYYENH